MTAESAVVVSTESSYTGQKIFTGYVMLDSRIIIVNQERNRFRVSNCRQVSSVVYFRQVLTIANRNYTVLVIKFFQESFAPRIGCSFIVFGCHIRHKENNVS